MKPALIRLALLLGVSLTLCVSSEPGLALAATRTKHPPTVTAKKTKHPTNAAQRQYTEDVPTIRGAKRHHKSKGTGGTSTRTTGTTSGRTTKKSTKRGRTGTASHRHRNAGRKHSGKSGVNLNPTPGHRRYILSSHRTHSGTGLTAAAATGSGGGTSVWLLVVLILVLATASVAGILRYRRNR